MIVTKEEFYDSDLWRCFPVIEVPYTDSIPDYPGAMGVPISAMDKIDYRYEDSQFELLAHARPIVDRKEIYERLVIRLRRPTLPDSFDLQELLNQYGAKCEVMGILVESTKEVKKSVVQNELF